MANEVNMAQSIVDIVRANKFDDNMYYARSRHAGTTVTLHVLNEIKRKTLTSQGI